ncbi:20141_t:CDS:1, partial [Racocetra fulgida]
TYYGEISCDNTGCLLKDLNFYMCYQFNKDEQNVCMLPEEDEINTNIFDRANFALIMIVDYIQGFFKMRKLRNKIPPPDPQRPNEQDPRYITDLNSYFLGQQFSFNAGQTGLPVYFSDGKIEIAYRYNADIENSLELATLIVAQLQQQQ